MAAKVKYRAGFVMDMRMTIALIGGAALLLLVGIVMERRPYRPGALIPWTAVQFLALLALLVFAAHVVELITGRPLHR